MEAIIVRSARVPWPRQRRPRCPTDKRNPRTFTFSIACMPTRLVCGVNVKTVTRTQARTHSQVLPTLGGLSSQFCKERPPKPIYSSREIRDGSHHQRIMHQLLTSSTTLLSQNHDRYSSYQSPVTASEASNVIRSTELRGFGGADNQRAYQQRLDEWRRNILLIKGRRSRIAV